MFTIDRSPVVIDVAPVKGTNHGALHRGRFQALGRFCLRTRLGIGWRALHQPVSDLALKGYSPNLRLSGVSCFKVVCCPVYHPLRKAGSAMVL